jgi:membrane associated rhomboid family serine protease
MIVTAVLGYELMGHFVFTFDRAFGELHLWTPLTYVFFNPPSLWTLIGCYLLWSFGEAAERHLGRRAFVRMFAAAVARFAAAHHRAGTARHSRSLVARASLQLEFGVFVAFATLYPRAKISIIILTIDAWVLAAIFVGLNALGSLAARDWASLLLLAANVGTAYAFIRYENRRVEAAQDSQSRFHHKCEDAVKRSLKTGKSRRVSMTSSTRSAATACKASPPKNAALSTRRAMR